MLCAALAPSRCWCQRLTPRPRRPAQLPAGRRGPSPGCLRLSGPGGRGPAPCRGWRRRNPPWPPAPTGGIAAASALRCQNPQPQPLHSCFITLPLVGKQPLLYVCRSAAFRSYRRFQTCPYTPSLSIYLSKCTDGCIGRS